MSTLESDRPRRRLPAIIFLFLIIVIGLLGGAYYLGPRFEREAPQIKFTPDSDVLGLVPMEIGVSDQGAALKSVTPPGNCYIAKYALLARLLPLLPAVY